MSGKHPLVRTRVFWGDESPQYAPATGTPWLGGDAATLRIHRPEAQSGSEPLPVGKRAVALLRVLVERAGAPVSKDTMIEAAWSGLAVEESNLTVQIAALRRALGEVPGGEDWIVTQPRRGHRFVGPVVTKSEAQVSAAPMADPASKLSPTTAPALPDKPSIAVLPFENLSGDPEQGYFADGMVEEIITALSRIRWLFVIARNSSFTYKGRAVDVKKSAKNLGSCMYWRARFARLETASA